LWQERFHFRTQHWERLLDPEPDERIVNVLIVAMGKTVAKTDDPCRCFRIGLAKTDQRFADNVEVAFYKLPYPAVTEERVERFAIRVFGNVLARLNDIVKQLR
jgi:hypothetical protein